jgi:hypothetical protein
MAMIVISSWNWQPIALASTETDTREIFRRRLSHTKADLAWCKRTMSLKFYGNLNESVSSPAESREQWSNIAAVAVAPAGRSSLDGLCYWRQAWRRVRGGENELFSVMLRDTIETKASRPACDRMGRHDNRPLGDFRCFPRRWAW